MNHSDFVKTVAAYIKKYAPTYGIEVVSPIIAQAVLESGYGTSELAVNAHNYFGLKYREGRCKTCIGIYHMVGSEQNADGSYTSSAMQWCKFKDMETELSATSISSIFRTIKISKALPTLGNTLRISKPMAMLRLTSMWTTSCVLLRHGI